MDSFPRFLPDDVGAGLEARCHGALAGERAAVVPHLGSDWGARLVGAGFTIEAERTFAIDLKPPLPAATGRYGKACLRRRRSNLDGRMSADDLATLDALPTATDPRVSCSATTTPSARRAQCGWPGGRERRARGFHGKIGMRGAYTLICPRPFTGSIG